MKNFLIACSFTALILTGCSSTGTGSTDTPADPSSQVSENSNNYTDEKTGISFDLPEGWIASTDEGGNLYAYRSKPTYETVTFMVFDSKTTWQARMDEFNKEATSSSESADTLVEKKELDLANYPSTMMTFSRRGQFEYTKYFVDAENQWFEVSASDITDAEVQHILETLKF